MTLHWWPLMWKSDHRAVEMENHTLRDALREANAEVRKHRNLLATLRTGQREATEQLERVFKVSP